MDDQVDLSYLSQIGTSCVPLELRRRQRRPTECSVASVGQPHFHHPTIHHAHQSRAGRPVEDLGGAGNEVTERAPSWKAIETKTNRRKRDCAKTISVYEQNVTQQRPHENQLVVSIFQFSTSAE